MVHYPPFFFHFLHALYDLDANKAVGEHKSEEYAFGFQIVLFVFNRLLPLLFCPLTIFMYLPGKCKQFVEQRSLFNL